MIGVVREVCFRRYGGIKEGWEFFLCGMENGKFINENFIKELICKMYLYCISCVREVIRKKVEIKRIFI